MSREHAMVRELIAVHDGLRRELKELRGAPELTRDLRVRCAYYCHHVEMHHTVESHYLFTTLRARFPESAEVIDRLEREHAKVAEILSAIEQAADFRPELDRLAAELLAHLDYEEEQLAPLLSRL
ncbi:hemerythrin domain-containing protein [Nonomuraea typhae]|uniref:hemerythrin domain-containing protein n=1 Tax=Nonomuraea typhae TaxID=2603600 RepID=UPI0012FAA283|nr:hemerythrin domain-containing protein [Nonomuraea typhae]